MKFIGDFHIHSHFSLATSKQLVPEYLEYWAKIKGITVVGTGDFSHPGWIKELKEKLVPAEEGLFKLKDAYRLEESESFTGNIRFMLTAEISSIYKKTGKVRKVHNILFAPDFDTVEKFQERLLHLGFNITSDGRPILGMDSRDLLELALDINENIFFVPAHIWTPWFSVLGAKSGFDTVTECFDDLSDHIYAVETGLSSDPPLNWMCTLLDKYTLISNSDAHSPEKLGRNANIFNTEISYPSIINSLKTGSPETCLGTIDMFPQEGKYHYDGHRKCGICWNPVETLEHDGICSVCERKVTIGVTSRIAQLSDREDITQRPGRLPFHSIIPLKEILSEIKNTGPNSKTIAKEYINLIKKSVSEFNILLDMPVQDIKNVGGEVLAEAIQRMRNKEIYISEGFDGEYGQIKVFEKGEVEGFGNNRFAFSDTETTRKKPAKRPLLNFDLNIYRELQKTRSVNTILEDQQAEYNRQKGLLKRLNKEQVEAVKHYTGPAIILAGPGTGKTKTLTVRIAHLIQNQQILPENILAVTFTNKAAEEMRERISELLDDINIHSKIHIFTFHALGYNILKENVQLTGRKEPFSIISDEDKISFLSSFVESKEKVKSVVEKISAVKQRVTTLEEINDEDFGNCYSRYNEALQENNAFDLDDLLLETVLLLKNNPKILDYYRNKYHFILVDEYQDVNSAQYEIIRLLSPDNNSNICVIGDPNQAIYGFRGADIRYINQFTEDYANAKVFSLKRSYRCSNRILKASENIILTDDFSINSLEGLQKGVKINIVHEATEKSEAEFVARTIEKMIGGVRFFSIDSKIAEGNEDAEIKSLSDFAILCRIGRQIQAFVKAFKDHGIPYQVVGDDPFFKKQPIVSIIDTMKLIVNPQNRILKNKLSSKNIINKNEISNLKNLSYSSVEDLIQQLIQIYFQKQVAGKETEINYLITLAKQYDKDIHSFIQFVSLGTSSDTYKPTIENVTLMTLHASKGLEFNCVFISGCENGLIPYSLFENQQSDLDEEKRLLYVGMTRAKKYLYLTHAHKRFLMGKDYNLARSPFLDKIEKDLIEIKKQSVRKKEKSDNQLKLF